MKSVYDWLRSREGKLTAALVATTGVIQLATEIDPDIMGAANIAIAAWILFLFGPGDETE